MKKYFWIIAGALAAIYIASKVTLTKNINVFFKGFNLSGGLLSPEIDINLAVQNLSSTSATIQNIQANITINDIVAGYTQQAYNLQILPNNTTELPIPVLLDVFNIVDIANSLKTSGTKINIKGTITADGINIPINSDYVI
jgi:LEA14-like dessication related protein